MYFGHLGSFFLSSNSTDKKKMNSVFLLVNLADFLHQEETNQSREEGTYQAEIEFQRKGHF